MTAEETLKIINKQWATTKDIMKIACIGEARALKIKKSIERFTPYFLTFTVNFLMVFP